MGFTAIVYASHNDIQYAALCILIAGIFDTLDGAIARLLKATSEFGVELDSLCDAVSFGIAPAFIAYQVYFNQMGELGVLLSSLPALAGVMRLARFNIKTSAHSDKRFFTGLPIPGNALTIVSFIVFLYKNETYFDLQTGNVLLIIVTLLCSLLMVSNIKFNAIPKPSWRSIKQNPFVFGVFILAIVVSAATKGMFIFPFMLFYIAFSVTRHLVVWIKLKREASDEIDETEGIDDEHFDM